MSTSVKTAFLLTLVVVVVLTANVFAQNQIATQPQNVNGSGSPAVVVAPPTVYVVAGGIYGTGVYVAPAATLPAQNTGISLANQAGISLQAPLQTGVSTAVPATSNWGSGYGAAAYEAAGYNGYNGTIGGPAVTQGEAGVAQSGRLINDLGPSYYAGAAPAAEGAGPSLAEIAAGYKTGRNQNVRMYTNADAERIVAGVRTGTASMQAAQQSGAPLQMAQASMAPATRAPASQPSSSATSATNSTASSQNQTASQPSNATTPQVGKPAENTEQSNPSLPATASILPFLSFLGLLSGGAGLWLIKFRK